MAGKADESDIDSIKQISEKLSHYEHLIGEFDKLANEGYDPAFTILHLKNSSCNFIDYVDKSTWFHAERDKQTEYRKRVWDKVESDAVLIRELKQITQNGEFPIPTKHRRYTLLKCIQMEVGMRGEPNGNNPFKLVTPLNNDRELIEEVNTWDKDSQQWYYLYCGEEIKTQLYYMTLDAFDLVCKGWNLFAPLFESQSEEFNNVKKYGLSTWLQLLIFASIQGKLNTQRRPQIIALDERLE